MRWIIVWVYNCVFSLRKLELMLILCERLFLIGSEKHLEPSICVSTVELILVLGLWITSASTLCHWHLSNRLLGLQSLWQLILARSWKCPRFYMEQPTKKEEPLIL